jgi:hypothetical protein
MPTVVFVVSSPLHLFVTLGLMRGPYREHRKAVAIINERPQRRDFLAEALKAVAGDEVTVERFFVLKRHGKARDILAAISAFTRLHRPDVLAAGNDAKLEFFAAVRGCPTARVVYLDDGLYSYLPIRDASPAWWQAISDWRRGLKYGVPVRQGPYLGGSKLVQEGYVLLPEQAHPPLARKPVHRLEARWFADPWVRAICLRAAEGAGFDAERCRAIGLLLLVPQLDMMQKSPALRHRFEALAARHGARGELVAIKRHPRAEGEDVGFALDLPAAQWVEIPPRLPIEALVPLLSSGTLVAGALTTGLLTLALLGDGLQVRSVMALEPGRGKAARFNNGAARIYESVGIVPVEIGTPLDAPGPG